MNMKSTMCWLTCTNKCSYLNTRRPINYFGRWVLAARAKAVSKRYPEVNQWKNFTNRINQSNRSKELPFQNSGDFPLGSRRALLDCSPFAACAPYFTIRKDARTRSCLSWLSREAQARKFSYSVVRSHVAMLSVLPVQFIQCIQQGIRIETSCVVLLTCSICFNGKTKQILNSNRAGGV